MKTAIVLGLAVAGSVGAVALALNINAVRTRIFRLPALP